MQSQFLTNYTETTFLEKIKDNLRHCKAFDFSVSFIKKLAWSCSSNILRQHLSVGAKVELLPQPTRTLPTLNH